MHNKFLVWFEEVDKHDVGLVGGKGANLGEMTRAGFPIPYGFILTSAAYFYFIEKQGIKDKIAKLLRNLDHRRPEILEQAAGQVRELIKKTPVPESLCDKIAQYYEQIYEQEEKAKHIITKLSQRIKATYSPALVAVRSSATAEDLPDASFAGQQETFLNVQGEANLIEKIRACWASLFTARAVFYRAEKGFDHFKVGLAAVVQRMIQADRSGIMFTVDPVSNDKKSIVIEAIYGLGEYIVQGKVTPDQFVIDKRSLEIKSKKIGLQDVKLVKVGKLNKEIKLTKAEGGRQKITNNQVKEIARLGVKIEKHYFFPQDIEWAIEGKRIFITQSRPVTTLQDQTNTAGQTLTGNITVKREVIAKGDPASPGIASGEVIIIHSPKEIAKVQQGNVLVASQTNPDYVPAMKRASAIVTEHGGRTSHAAIVSRELGIPCVVGVENALKILSRKTVVTINGTTGEIYAGKVEIQTREETKHVYKTRTKIYINLAEPEKAAELSSLPVQGVGLLRAEFMIANIGEHPKALLQDKQGYVFTNKLKKDIETICKAFYPRPVVYRTTDFKTNEYRYLKGGKKFEPVEPNPMLGYRGVYRYITDPEVFKLELEAIKKVREAGYSNLHIMFPFVTRPQHLQQAKDFVEKQGLKFSQKFKLWMMVEIPVNVIMLEEFLRVGVHGVSIGSNDLTMLLLGVDRDNETVASLYDERNEALYWALRKTIHSCTNHGVTSSICGQSVSDYTEILEVVVKAGITSVSVNPDTVWRVNQNIYSIENHGSSNQHT